MAVSAFFNKFPKINYDINNSTVNKRYEEVTNIFFRIGYLREILNNTSSYYVYEIEDGDTPEILAEKIYGDPGAHWMIIYANKILDPQFDWPLDYDAFQNYIIGKYGSIETAKTTVHHYEKVITRINYGPSSDVTTQTRIIVDKEKLSDNTPDDPYDYYDNLPVVDTEQSYTVDGTVVVEKIGRDSISCYDYEEQYNESKRTLKVIKKEYYRRVMGEFDTITKSTPSFARRVV